MATILFNEIPFSNTDLVTPGRGAEQWHDRNDVNVPTQGINTIPFDVYYRTTWTRFETSKGVYNWAWLRQRLTDAISKKQTFHFGIMPVYTGVDGNTGGVLVDGTWSSVPEYVIREMQAESVKPFKAGGTWVMNWNSPSYHGNCLRVCQAINNFIQTETINGVPARFVVGIIDIRLYGNWGEWHSAGIVPDNQTVQTTYPAGTFPTASSLIKIVDAHRLGFPNNPLVAMISGYDSQWLQNTWNPAEIANYLLTARNNWGEFGWRRDNWGATDQYIDSYLINNTRSFNGVPHNSLIMQKWTKTPITGEPPAWNPGDYFDLENQIRKYRATSFGNGNYGPTMNSTIQSRVRAASKATGYRFVVRSATTTASGSTLQIAMNWQNVGLGNCWQEWQVEFELIGTNWRGISKFNPKFYQPKTSAESFVDNFGITGVNPGTYALRFRVKDPNNYRRNMALAIQGADANFYYSLGTVTIGSTPPVNQGPKANAGGDIVITQPQNSAQLNGSGSDPDGTIVSYQWQKLSGQGTLQNPNSAVTQLTGLNSPGITVLNLTVTDNQGATGTDDLNVTVNGTIPVPKPIKKIEANIENYLVTYTDDTQQVIDA